MGTSKTPAQMAGKIEKLAKEMANINPTLNAVGLRGKEIFLVSAGSAVGAKPKGKRKKISARYDMRGRGNAIGEGQVVITYQGPAQLINNPTRAHLILPRQRAGVRSRRRGARALTINSDVVASAHHPGTKGKRFYEKAKVVCQRELPRIFQRKSLTEPLKRTFG